MLADRALVPRQRMLDALLLVPRRPMLEGHPQDRKRPTELERSHRDHTQHMEALRPRPRDMITQDDDSKIPSLLNNTVVSICFGAAL
jgi:hypothetical protein